MQTFLTVKTKYRGTVTSIEEKIGSYPSKNGGGDFFCHRALIAVEGFPEDVKNTQICVQSETFNLFEPGEFINFTVNAYFKDSDLYTIKFDNKIFKPKEAPKQLNSVDAYQEPHIDIPIEQNKQKNPPVMGSMFSVFAGIVAGFHKDRKTSTMKDVITDTEVLCEHYKNNYM